VPVVGPGGDLQEAAAGCGVEPEIRTRDLQALGVGAERAAQAIETGGQQGELAEVDMYRRIFNYFS
jgi:hypothetical protein